MAESAERESKKWIARCKCGHERSIWDLGGVRYKACGNPRRLMKCPSCKKMSWHRIAYRDQACDNLHPPIQAELVGPGDSSKKSLVRSLLSAALNLAFVLLSIVSALASMVGLLLVVIAISFLLQVSAYSSNARHVTGTVIDVQRGRVSRPVVSYVVADEEYRVQGRIGLVSSPYDLGESVSVCYDPADPYDARIDDWVERGGPFACIGSILGMTGSGGLLLVWWRRRRATRGK